MTQILRIFMEMIILITPSSSSNESFSSCDDKLEKQLFFTDFKHNFMNNIKKK